MHFGAQFWNVREKRWLCLQGRTTTSVSIPSFDNKFPDLLRLTVGCEINLSVSFTKFLEPTSNQNSYVPNILRVKF